MKQFFLAASILLFGLMSNAQKVLVNDANAVERQLSGSFNAIKVSGGIDIYLSQYETESIAVSASEPKYRDRIKTEVNGGVLEISYDNEGLSWNSGKKKMKVYISFKNLERLEASGASDVLVTGVVTSSSLEIRMSGASDFKGAIKANTLNVKISGASDAKISGTATDVTIESSGASDFKGYDLVCDNCNARASGASDINITVNKILNPHASGASDIFYKGTAMIKDLETSGASTISRKD